MSSRIYFNFLNKVSRQQHGRLSKRTTARLPLQDLGGRLNVAHNWIRVHMRPRLSLSLFSVIEEEGRGGDLLSFIFHNTHVVVSLSLSLVSDSDDPTAPALCGIGGKKSFRVILCLPSSSSTPIPHSIIEKLLLLLLSKASLLWGDPVARPATQSASLIYIDVFALMGEN